jgi:hypothetical protein
MYFYYTNKRIRLVRKIPGENPFATVRARKAADESCHFRSFAIRWQKICGVSAMKFTGKEQCWERMGCGRDRDQSCPAYPDYGRLCWPIAGTKCRGTVAGSHAQKIRDCETCEFFKAVVFSGLEEE